MKGAGDKHARQSPRKGVGTGPLEEWRASSEDKGGIWVPKEEPERGIGIVKLVGGCQAARKSRWKSPSISGGELGSTGRRLTPATKRKREEKKRSVTRFVLSDERRCALVETGPVLLGGALRRSRCRASGHCARNEIDYRGRKIAEAGSFSVAVTGSASALAEQTFSQGQLYERGGNKWGGKVEQARLARRL